MLNPLAAVERKVYQHIRVIFQNLLRWGVCFNHVRSILSKYYFPAIEYIKQRQQLLRQGLTDRPKNCIIRPRMANDNVILRFSDVSFEYGHEKPVLEEAGFSVRAGSRITLMGQNGAGKSSLFKLITGELKPVSGAIYLTPKNVSIAVARQVMPLEMLDLTVREYFATAFKEERYNLDKLINEVFEVVNVKLPLDKKIKEFSGGQQARLLLAHALIQHPDILLLDEPTNNLDQQGIEHLTGFLMMYEKTCIVISHDADFLNAFSDGVLYLDVFTHKIEQYAGNYYDVVKEIEERIKRENLQNARMQMQIQEKRTQAEVFAHKGGKLRAVAKRMREAAEEAEENIVSVRKEDKSIREFDIPVQEFDKHFDIFFRFFRCYAHAFGYSPQFAA